MDTVLVVTGAGEAATARLRTLPALGRRYRVLALHVGGEAAQLAEEAVTMLGAAGVGSAHIYGISFGGIVAQHIAARHPDRVRRLVLAATPAGVDPDVATRGFLERRAHMPPAEALWATVPYAYALATRRAAADRIGEDVAEALRLPLELDEPAGRAAPLGDIAAPTLVLHGAEDLLVPPANGRALAAAIPGAELVELDGAAHHYATDVLDGDRNVLRFLATGSRDARRRSARGART
jgi:pimeloyl-ACP methyl ester carboxylesterase